MVFIDTLEPRQFFAAGALDATFGGGDGSVDVRLNVHAWTPGATDVAVDDEGRSLLAAVYGGKHDQVSLTRLTADGAVDVTFGVKGIATFALPAGARSGGIDLAVDHNGRPLVMLSTGSTPIPSVGSGATIVRLTEAGVVDKRFGNGAAAVPFVTSAADLTVDASNDVIVVGTSQGKTGTRGTIVRMTYRGLRDATFGSGGAYKTPVPLSPRLDQPGNASGTAVKVLSDGRIVGVSSTSTADNSGIDGTEFYGSVDSFRLSSSGKLDASYGTHGTTSLVRDDGQGGELSDAFEAFYSGGGLIVSTTRSEDDRGEVDRYWTYVDADGRVKKDDFTIVKKQLAMPPTATQASVAAIQDDNQPIVASYLGPIYRLGAGFGLDMDFAPVQLQQPQAVLLSGGRALAFNRVFEPSAGYVPGQVRVTAITL